MSSLCCFDVGLAESLRGVGWSSALSAYLTICIIVITVEASSAMPLINVNCIRSQRRSQGVTACVSAHP